MDKSPDEELDAGVSTMKLQTKRLSGAQRRKLTKEKKIKEGTWTIQKPQKKEVERDSGSNGRGIKRPHSDSNTPFSLENHCKKPRSSKEQTRSYSDVAAGIRMAITNRRHPDVPLEQRQVDLLQGKIIEAVDAYHGETPPQFLNSKFVHGILWVTCVNEDSKLWLIRTVNGLVDLWEDAELIIINSKDLFNRPRVIVWIPDTAEEEKVKSRLRIQNPGLKTENWLVMSRKVAENGQTLTFYLDLASYTSLKKDNFKAYWGLGRVTFKTLGREWKIPKDEDVAGESPSQ